MVNLMILLDDYNHQAISFDQNIYKIVQSLNTQISLCYQNITD